MAGLQAVGMGMLCESSVCPQLRRVPEFLWFDAGKLDDPGSGFRGEFRRSASAGAITQCSERPHLLCAVQAVFHAVS